MDSSAQYKVDEVTERHIHDSHRSNDAFSIHNRTNGEQIVIAN